MNLSPHSLNVLQWARYLVERWLIIPAATWLPLHAALRLADAAAVLDMLVPTRTSRTALAEIRATTGLTGWPGVKLAWERLAMPRRELVYLTRMRDGRERLDDWRVVELNGEKVQEMAAAGRSFVIATGHFSSAAINVAQRTLPRPAAFMAGETPCHAVEPGELRRQLEDQCRDTGRIGLLGPSYAADELWIRVPDVWGPDADWNDTAQRVAPATKMLSVLRQAGGIVLVRIDAIWEAASAFSRPFAGVGERKFALGAARAARLAQCPLVPFVATLADEPRTVIVEWGDPIPPPPKQDKQADVLTLSRALAHIEAAIGRYPTQYLAHIGWERRWQPKTLTWEPA